MFYLFLKRLIRLFILLFRFVAMEASLYGVDVIGYRRWPATLNSTQDRGFNQIKRKQIINTVC